MSFASDSAFSDVTFEDDNYQPNPNMYVPNMTLVQEVAEEEGVPGTTLLSSNINVTRSDGKENRSSYFF